LAANGPRRACFALRHGHAAEWIPFVRAAQHAVAAARAGGGVNSAALARYKTEAGRAYLQEQRELEEFASRNEANHIFVIANDKAPPPLCRAIAAHVLHVLLRGARRRA